MLKTVIALGVLLAMTSPSMAMAEKDQQEIQKTRKIKRDSSKQDDKKKLNYGSQLGLNDINSDDDSDSETEPTRIQKLRAGAREFFSPVTSFFGKIWNAIFGA